MRKDVWNSFPHVALLLCGGTAIATGADADADADADTDGPEIVHGDVVVMVW